jgi:hypothetical protein
MNLEDNGTNNFKDHDLQDMEGMMTTNDQEGTNADDKELNGDSATGY